MSSRWENENWHVSHWNYLDEVVKGFTLPKTVKIHDITLRDGEQQAGVIFTKDDKIRIAEKLAEAGIHRIEAGMPAVSPNDEAAVREIVKRNLGPEIFCFARCMEKDVQLAYDCGVKGIVIEIPASKHLVEQGYNGPWKKRWSFHQSHLFGQGKRAVHGVFHHRRHPFGHGLAVGPGGKGGRRRAHGRLFPGGHLWCFVPHAAYYFTKKVKERIDKPLEIHFHSDFGMGVANTIMAITAGAEVIHSTVLGIGERAGNTPWKKRFWPC